MDIKKYLDKKRRFIDRALLKNLPESKGIASQLIEAMRYSVLIGGKRLRPILMLEIAKMLGSRPVHVLQAACAVEYIHTSTLILDDLPCMDNSNMRRGSLSVHEKFGESTAILASYSLVVLAFELLVENATKVIKDPELIYIVTREVSKGVGHDGVCAGQYLDLKAGAGKINIGMLTSLHEHKTADLFVVCCKIAAHLSSANKRQLRALESYGRYLGLAFQAYDDILSVRRTDRQLGKETKKDKDSPNIVNLFGERKANGLVGAYVKKAEAQLDVFKGKADTLKAILRYIAERGK